MGLTITAYCGLEQILSPRLDSSADPVDTFAVRFYDAPRFLGHSEGINTARIYRYANSYEFAAGSYGMYRIWREQLARLAGYPAVDEPGSRSESGRRSHECGAIAAGAGPFYELIHFPATHGTIGPKVSGKLAEDFSRFMCAVDVADDRTFALFYVQWFHAFTLASHSGAVQFH